MKVAHFCSFGLHASGQYGTTKELIQAELALGIDARFIPTNGVGPIEDGWLKSTEPKWAKEEADVMVRHTAIYDDIEILKKPTICCLHGRPESTFVLDMLKKPAKPHQIPNYYQAKPEQSLIDTIIDVSKKDHYKLMVTFWQEFMLHWRYTLGDNKSKLRYVPAPVDLDLYKPEGDTLDWPAESKGEPNILIADIWREDNTPFNIIHAAAYFRDHYCPKAKLHVFGVPDDWNTPIKNLLFRFRDAGLVPEIHYTAQEIDQIYRMMDIVITPHNFATRVIRESLASGLPVVAGGGCPYTPYNCDPHDIPGFAGQIFRCYQSIYTGKLKEKERQGRKQARQMAERSFDLKQTGEAMVEVLEEALGQRKANVVPESKTIKQETGGLGRAVL